MSGKLLVPGHGEMKRRLLDRFAELHELALEGADPGLRKVAAGLLRNVEAPFLFVVAGEVKSGKSSFVNALLGADVCAVAPDPCTDTIQKIVHADEPYERDVREHVREIGRPRDILKDVAIVDTPGTNSIIHSHQEITEQFVPEADLVIFVLPALNPYPRSMWDFLGFIRSEWHKKLIFVLQQADRATPEELAVNRERVREYAEERGIEAPRIFTVSAKRELDGAGDSGMDAVWDYVRATVTGGRHLVLKMESLVNTGLSLAEKIRAEAEEAKAVLAADVADGERIRTRLRMGRESSEREIEVLAVRLGRCWDEAAGETVERFEEGLSPGSLFRHALGGFFGRKNGIREWLAGLNARFHERLAAQTDIISREAAANVSEALSLSMQSLADELQGARARTAGKVRVSAIMERRLGVVDEVVRDVSALLSGDELADRLRPQGLGKIGERAFMGGFLTALGAVIAAATHIALVDVTGGVVTTVGLALVVNSAFFKRRSVIRGFRNGLEQGRERFMSDLDERLTEQIGGFNRRLEEVFDPFFENIDERSTKLAAFCERLSALETALKEELARLEAQGRTAPSHTRPESGHGYPLNNLIRP